MTAQRALVGLSLVCCLTVYAGEPASDGFLNCLLVNKVSDAGELRALTDRQIENGLCQMTAQAVLEIAANDRLRQEPCIRASANLLKEFNRRFPRREAKEVLNRCR